MSAFSHEKETRLDEITAFLRTVTPTTIHLITNARWGTKVNFESVWYAHGPQAAIYLLLSGLYYKRIRRREPTPSTAEATRRPS